MFLLHLFAKFLDLNSQYTLDVKHGDYHNSGDGDWQNNNPKISWIGANWEHTYFPSNESILFYTHRHEYIYKLKKLHPDISIVAIDCDQEDYKNITKMYIKKAWPNLWTKKEYDRWVSTGCVFPPYSNDNLNDEVVYNMLHDQLNQDTVNWHQNLPKDTDYIIKFKTLFGLDNNSIENIIEKIIGKSSDLTISEIINDYQTINRQLYFT